MNIENKRNGKILLADDEQWYVEGLKDTLLFEGYTVEGARTGTDTLHQVKSPDKRPDLLILDIMMNPGLLQGEHHKGTRTGLVVLHTIREQYKLDEKALPVICLSVVNEDEVLKDIAALHAQYASKTSISMAEIVQMVNKILKPSKRGS